MKWIAIVALPILILWVIGFPLFGLIILIKNRKQLDNPRIQSYFLILYQGFKNDRFYWEFISAFRKFAILSIYSLLHSFSIQYQILCSSSKLFTDPLVVLIFFYYFQRSMAPFKSAENNSIDLLAITVGIVTIYSGLIFSLEDEVLPFIYSMTWLVLIVFNTYF